MSTRASSRGEAPEAQNESLRIEDLGERECGERTKGLRGATSSLRGRTARPRWQTTRSQERPSEAVKNQDALTCDAIDELCSSAA